MSGSSPSHAGHADVFGARIYYEIAGEGHPLVLNHAGIANSAMWDEQFGAFARHYRVLRYDMRGFGKSSVPPGPCSLRGDLRQLLHVVGVEGPVYMMGVSMGGGAAIDFTIEYPDMVDALIPVAAGLGGFEPREDESTAWVAEQRAAMEAAEQAGNIALINELEVRMWVDGRTRTPEQVNPMVRERVRVMNGEALARESEQARAEFQRLDPPAVRRLGEIHAPTLIIEGALDRSDVLQAGDALAAGIAGARKVVMHGTAHVPNMEQPDEFNRLVLEFLEGLQQQP